MKYMLIFLCSDLRNIRRDSLLLYLLILPWGLVLLMRSLLPVMAEWLAVTYQFALPPYYPLLLSVTIFLQLPMMFGLVFGLLLLDERDEGILKALQVTPASVEKYIFYRMAVTIILSVIFLLGTLPLTGLIKIPPLGEMLFLAFLTGLMAVCILLALVSFASNKLEGLALMKAMGIFLLGPFAAYFSPGKGEIFWGILPTYWPVKAFWLITTGEKGRLYLVVGFLYFMVLLYLLLGKLQHKIKSFQ